MERLLTERQLALVLSLDVVTLRRWRLDGLGPKPTKLAPARNGPVLYRECHLTEWLNERDKAPCKSYSKGLRPPVAERIRLLRERYNPPSA